MTNICTEYTIRKNKDFNSRGYNRFRFRLVVKFFTNISFELNLGLKQALATVNDYNPLMKDFPLDDLLAATELDKIRAALSAIFSHLKKIRSTKYPIQRALRLVEAISRDLSSQLLKVHPFVTGNLVLTV